MLKTATIAAALIVAASPLALAQTSTQPRTAPTSPSTAPSATTTPGTGTGTAGSSMMSEADLKKQLEQQGYSQVQLRDDTSSSEKGDWAGTAMKNGKQVNIHVDPSGKVRER
jgi:hypothetical protein